MTLEDLQERVASEGVTPDNLIQGFRYEAFSSEKLVTLMPYEDSTYWYCRVIGGGEQVYTKRPVHKHHVSYCWTSEKVQPQPNDWRVYECEPSEGNPFDAVLQKTGPRMGYIYFFQSVLGGPVKIGFATNVHARLETIQAMCPFQLKLLGIREGTHQDERNIHIMFHDQRDHGEWFSESDKLLDFIRKNAREYKDE
jgi:hypothetical protein